MTHESSSPGPDPEGARDWLGFTAALQGIASDPARSAWVSANAGSGKTHVLTQRVIRLLLAGCRPSAILCLTYTKAAASEMSNRVFARLAGWVTLDDAALEERIAAMEGETPGPSKLKEARRLFTRALETPGGLKIQTIHAFCEALLHQFPLEANVAGHFSVLDDRAATTLLAEARRLLLTAASGEEDPALASAFETVLDLADDTGLEKLLSAIIGKRADIAAFLNDARQQGGLDPALRRALGLAPGDTADRALARFWPVDGLAGPDLDRYIGMARDKGGVKVQAFADALEAAKRPMPAQDRHALLMEAFHAGGDKPKPRANSAFVSKAMLTAAPDLQDLVDRACTHIAACRERLDRLRLFEATQAALTLADRFNHDYEDIKKSRGQLDFDDLVNRTAQLLSRSDASAWVHYKLDQGIDHILVDEAQDTSPVQWDIIDALADDFFSGRSARETLRTMFAVGDEKQSIYSFQGARPQRFHEQRLATERKVTAGGRRFDPVRLQLSFRSTEDVLSAVDAVFADDGNARGVGFAGEPIVHASNRMRQPGQVDLWDMVAPPTVEPDEDWTRAFDAVPESAPVNILANRIAATLSQWIGHETIATPDGPRPIAAGDVIVLVRKRDAFVNALTRALKKRGNIPVGGADRLVLTGHIAAQDLMALGRFALLPADDLSLAALLKSPLFDLSEDDVFELAAGRQPEESAWSHLTRLGQAGTGRWNSVWKRLESAIATARDLPPFDFFADVLGPGGGRAAFLARLGSEASDILDEFLSFALAHEKAGLPGLQAFISALETDAPAIKREQDKGRNDVRIMTVHAAKGLEAPIVFVVDSGGKAFIPQHLPGLRLVTAANGGSVPVWRPSAAVSAALIDDDSARQKQLAEAEYRRLLYVAMTRAADRLVICGYRGKLENEGTWHPMILAALAADDGKRLLPHSFVAGDQQWRGMRWKNPAMDAGAQHQAVADRTTETIIADPLPPLLAMPVRETASLPRPLAPSGAGILIDDAAKEPMVASALFTGAQPANLSLLRGAILHRFLQILPAIAPAERRAAAARYLDRSVPRWTRSDKDAVIRSVLGVLDAPEAARIFDGHSRAEVSIMGTLTLGRRTFAVSGRVDRLTVWDGVVTIADFKTDRTVPASAQAVSATYRAQLAIYRALLRPLYPDHVFECLLIYTEGPFVCALPDAMLDESLEALATK